MGRRAEAGRQQFAKPLAGGTQGGAGAAAFPNRPGEDGPAEFLPSDPVGGLARDMLDLGAMQPEVGEVAIRERVQFVEGAVTDPAACSACFEELLQGGEAMPKAVAQGNIRKCKGHESPP